MQLARVPARVRAASSSNGACELASAPGACVLRRGGIICAAAKPAFATAWLALLLLQLQLQDADCHGPEPQARLCSHTDVRGSRSGNPPRTHEDFM